MENEETYLTADELVFGNVYKLLYEHEFIFRGVEGHRVYLEPCNKTNPKAFRLTEYNYVQCWSFDKSSISEYGHVYLIKDNSEKTVEEMVAAIHAMIVKIIR